MASYAKKAQFEILRKVSFEGITGEFLPLGNPLLHTARIVKFTNTTDALISISINGIDEHDVLGAGDSPRAASALYDVSSNGTSGSDFVFSKGDQIYIKSGEPATIGSFYITIVYALGD